MKCEIQPFLSTCSFVKYCIYKIIYRYVSNIEKRPIMLAVCIRYMENSMICNVTFYFRNVIVVLCSDVIVICLISLSELHIHIFKNGN
jgi:hypothetical protein